MLNVDRTPRGSGLYKTFFILKWTRSCAMGVTSEPRFLMDSFFKRAFVFTLEWRVTWSLGVESVGASGGVDHQRTLGHVKFTIVDDTVTSSNLLSLTSYRAGEDGHVVFCFAKANGDLCVTHRLTKRGTRLLDVPRVIGQKGCRFRTSRVNVICPVCNRVPPCVMQRFVQGTGLGTRCGFTILACNTEGYSTMRV